MFFATHINLSAFKSYGVSQRLGTRKMLYQKYMFYHNQNTLKCVKIENRD